MASNARAAERREAKDYLAKERVRRGNRFYGRKKGSVSQIVWQMRGRTRRKDIAIQ